MDGVLRVAAWALTALAKAAKIRAAAARLAVATLCTALAAILALAVLGCLAAALWIFALPSLGSVGASLAVAASLSGFVLILALAAHELVRRGRAKQDASIAPQLLMLEAMRLFSEHKGAVLLAAVVAGMAAANGSRKP